MKYDIIAIGASAGGIDALKKVLGKMKPSKDVAIIIVQHMGANLHSFMPQIVSGVIDMNVMEIEDKMDIKRGSVYIVPANYHALIEKRGYFSLGAFEKVCYARPSIDVTFESISDAFEDRVIGVILTGANHDGGHGLKHIKDRGGYTIVQNHLNAEAKEMPRFASQVTNPDEILELKEIGERLNQLISS